MRILFMGTPDIAAECLKALYAAGHDICAVYTRRDKPVGRKQVLTAPPSTSHARSRGLVSASCGSTSPAQGSRVPRKKR